MMSKNGKKESDKVTKGEKKFMALKDKLIKSGEPRKKAVAKANILVRKKG